MRASAVPATDIIWYITIPTYAVGYLIFSFEVWHGMILGFKKGKIFTEFTIMCAAAVALLGGVITGDYVEWLKLGLSVLVISCPCSLVLSVPLTYFAGLGAGAKRGIIFRGGESVDGIARMSACCFDKTGTLTESESALSVQSFLGK